MNGKSRQKATNIIEKDFFILLNNLHFGYMATIAEITLTVEKFHIFNRSVSAFINTEVK